METKGEREGESRRDREGILEGREEERVRGRGGVLWDGREGISRYIIGVTVDRIFLAAKYRGTSV